jgi:hypothetical protein
LIGGELQIRIKIKQPSDGDKANGYNDPRNEIAGVKSAGGAAPAMQNNLAPTGDRPKAPWEK